MLRALPSKDVRWVACVLCSIALTGCPQLDRDDFRIATNHPIGGRGGSGSVAGNNNVGASFSGGTGGTFRGDAAGGTAANGGTSTEVTGGSLPDGTGGSSADGTGGFDNVGGAAGTSSTSVPCGPEAFGNVELFTGLNVTGDIWSPSLSADGSTLFFETANHVYVATRANRGQAFSPAKLVPIEGSPSIQASPFLSSDGKSLYFTTTTTGSTDRDIWVATRADTTTMAFSGAQPIASVNSVALENRPWISSDQLTLLFTSARIGMGDNDIWMATRSSPSTLQFSVLPNLTLLNSRYRDGSAILSNDGLTVYFSSTRGSSGAGKLDIWTATRDASTNFSNLSTLGAVNNRSSGETDPALSSDETELLFVSDRSGKSQLYRATRSCTPD